jgi:hypothetical protein
MVLLRLVCGHGALLEGGLLTHKLDRAAYAGDTWEVSQCIARPCCAELEQMGMLQGTVGRCSDWSMDSMLHLTCGLLAHKLVRAAHTGGT